MAPSLDALLPRPALGEPKVLPKLRKLGLAKEDRRAVDLSSEDDAMMSRGSSNFAEHCAVLSLPRPVVFPSHPNRKRSAAVGGAQQPTWDDSDEPSKPAAKARKTGPADGPSRKRRYKPRGEALARRIQAPRSPDLSEASLGPSSESSEEEEEVAELLLGMGQAAARANAQRTASASKSSSDAISQAKFACTRCSGSVKICGDRKPVFVCSSCPVKSGGAYRSTKARLLEDGAAGRPIQVREALQLLGSSSSDEADAPLSPCKTTPSVEPPVEACGRCKCGKKISALHPPCKSELMLLCEKFQNYFGGGSSAGKGEIQLNDAAAKLKVQRRRLYDIINVLEAVEIIARTGKLTYMWRGKGHLPALLDHLMEEEAAGLPAVRARKSGPAGVDQSEQQRPATFSLWMLSRHFVRLLLVERRPLQLAEMATRLLGDEPRDRKAQTLVTVERRLYDIGSILCSVGLIEKTYLGRRQPAFAWCTAEGVPQPSRGWPTDAPAETQPAPVKAEIKPQSLPVIEVAAVVKAPPRPVHVPSVKPAKPHAALKPRSAAPAMPVAAPELKALPPPLTLEAPTLPGMSAALLTERAKLMPLHSMLPMSLPLGMRPGSSPMCMPPGMCLSWAPHHMFAAPGLVPGGLPMMGANHQSTMDLMRQLAALGQLAQAGPQPTILPPHLPQGSAPPMMFQIFPPASASMHGLPLPTMLLPQREP